MVAKKTAAELGASAFNPDEVKLKYRGTAWLK
jgi:hypothetical protein